MRTNLRKPCMHAGRYSFDSMLKIYVKIFVTIKKDKFESGSCWSETRSLCVHSRSHSFDQICMKHLNHVYTLEGIV